MRLKAVAVELRGTIVRVHYRVLERQPKAWIFWGFPDRGPQHLWHLKPDEFALVEEACCADFQAQTRDAR